MMRAHRLFIATLLLVPAITACTAASPSTATPTTPPTATPTHTLIPTHTPTHTLTHTPPPPPTHTPTSLPSPTPTYTPSPPPTPSPTPEISDADQAISPFEPPPRPFDYIVANPEPPRRVPNATRPFWVIDNTTGEHREIIARLRVQTEHTAMWVEEGVWHDVRAVEQAAAFFETQIYPTTRAAFGSEWTPGVDNDPHIHILHTTSMGEGVLGYTSSADEFPRALYPLSNEAEMITVRADLVGAGSPTYYGLLARQFQRMIQWYQDRNEERWVKEGLAELAVRLNGLDPGGLERAYLEHPDTSLTVWQAEENASHQGATYLFATYFHEQFGDAGTLALAAQPFNGIAGFDATVRELGADLTFDELFADWLAANYLDSEPQAKGPHHKYATLDLERPVPAAVYENYPVTVEASVQQFGADYILLRGDADLHVQFVGTAVTPLLDTPPHGGRAFWWSNRADESLTTLTRAFDLSDLSTAEPITLTYWAWYEIEPGYDYASLKVSTDDGEEWRNLSPPSSTADNPHHNNQGWGYTGQSGDPPGWIQETVDLSPYAGNEILVRFAYLTDEAVTGAGFALDDIAIPKIGYADDVEQGNGGWDPDGFVRSDNSVPQRYLALLIGIGSGDGAEGEVTVERLPMEGITEDGSVEWTVPLGSEGWQQAVIVLSGLAPLTTHPALYQLTIEK